MSDIVVRSVDSDRIGSKKLTLLIYSSAIFVSAFLVFSVQPLVAKMVLPLLGGAPAVWNTAMVFFQAALLFGYLYTHLLVRKTPLKFQGLVHLSMMALGALFLPFAVNSEYLPAGGDAPAWSLMMMFAVSVGVPFVVLSANAPLIQSWYSRTGNPDADDPYFLYGSSNIGSVFALLSYPVLVEPFLKLQTQTLAWTVGYVVLAVLIYLANRCLPSEPVEMAPAIAVASDSKPEEKNRSEVTWARRLRWIAAAAIPSSLMLGVTTHITTNIAAAPFLWVLPLTLYLLTFILVFERRKRLPTTSISLVYLGTFLVAVPFGLFLNHYALVGIVVHLVLFFAAALMCHADLARNRPSAGGLTGFYLCMSFGGVVGGAATALLAPVLFQSVLEYPIMLCLVGLFLPGVMGAAKDIRADVLSGAGALALAAVLVAASKLLDAKLLVQLAIVLLMAILYLLARSRPLRATILGFAVFATSMALQIEDLPIFQERSFFGVSSVLARDSQYGPLHVYRHGDTSHNTQLQDPASRREPLAYYAHEGPFGDIVDAARAVHGDGLRVAVVGLGAGALACHSRPGEAWTFYEIDPAVVRLATDPKLFTYVSDCAPQSPIVLGDARLTIAEKPDASYDLIIVDAFSSNTVPGHLITVEAMKMYREKLGKNGLLFMHVSNRYTDVASVAIAGAQALGTSSRMVKANAPDDAPFRALKLEVQAVVVGDDALLERALKGRLPWRKHEPNGAVSAWTDDFSNVVSAIAANLKGGPRPAE